MCFGSTSISLVRRQTDNNVIKTSSNSNPWTKTVILIQRKKVLSTNSYPNDKKKGLCLDSIGHSCLSKSSAWSNQILAMLNRREKLSTLARAGNCDHNHNINRLFQLRNPCWLQNQFAYTERMTTLLDMLDKICD